MVWHLELAKVAEFHRSHFEKRSPVEQQNQYSYYAILPDVASQRQLNAGEWGRQSIG